MLRGFLMLAAFFGFTGVALGAFAAHGLKNRLSRSIWRFSIPASPTNWCTPWRCSASRCWPRRFRADWSLGPACLFAVGILLFSGSLYVLTTTGISKLGIITPFGGLAFLVGWLCLGLAAWRLQLTA